MYSKLKHSLLIISVTAFCQTAQAAWDEGINGELSADSTSPTAISIISGSNVITGANSAAGTAGRDIFEITLLGSQQLDNIILNAYTGPVGEFSGTGSFFAAQSGSGINTTSADDHLGNALIGKGAGNSPTNNVLDDLGFAVLGAGTYTFWFQETAGTTTYEFDFQVSEVPLPAAAWLFGSALLGLGLVKRRKASA